MRSAEGDETAAAMALSTGLEAAMAADERSGTGVSLWLLEAAADSNDALYTADAGSASACCIDAMQSTRTPIVARAVYHPRLQFLPLRNKTIPPMGVDLKIRNRLRNHFSDKNHNQPRCVITNIKRI